MALPPFWVASPPKKTLVVQVADMIASNDPGADVVTYALGSCVGVVVHEPVRKVGGLLHPMLPDSSLDPAKARACPYMFVDTGLQRLFEAMRGLGAEPHRLVIKLAGGANCLDEDGFFNIGERNVTAVRRFLASRGLMLRAQDVAGRSSRTIRLDIATGTVRVHVNGSQAFHL